MAVYRDDGKQRARRICDAWQRGLNRRGVASVVRDGVAFNDAVEADVAIFYGLRLGLREVFETYRAEATAVYVDLGYWGRKPANDRLGGYHKVSVNALHPTAYLRVGHRSDRLDQVGLRVKPWRRTGAHVIVAGMSDKSAAVNGFAPEAWERRAIAEVKKHTDRPIRYRPKPSWDGARPISGTAFGRGGTDVRPHLRDCWALATHHSNAAVDALAAGIPVYCEEGAASLLSMPSLDRIDDPPLPDGRADFLADLAYCQWSVAEIASGACWDYPVGDGLV